MFHKCVCCPFLSVVLYLNGTTISNTTGVMNYVQWWNSLRTFLLAASSLGMTGGDYVFLTAMMNPLGAPNLVKEFGGEGTVGTVLHEAFRSLLVVTVDAHGGGASTENFISEVERSAYGAGNLQADYQQVMSACAHVCVCVCVSICPAVSLVDTLHFKAEEPKLLAYTTGGAGELHCMYCHCLRGRGGKKGEERGGRGGRGASMHTLLLER